MANQMNLLSSEIAGLDLAAFMRHALDEAEAAGRAGQLPIGAIVVIDGQIIARGRARHKELRNQLRHAELNALLEGGEPLWTNYDRAILFTNVEPCPLCLGAVVMADVPHVVFALEDRVVYSPQTIEANPYVRRHLRTYHGGVLAAESAAIIGRYAPDLLRYITTGGGAPPSVAGL